MPHEPRPIAQIAAGRSARALPTAPSLSLTREYHPPPEPLLPPVALLAAAAAGLALTAAAAPATTRRHRPHPIDRLTQRHLRAAWRDRLPALPASPFGRARATRRHDLYEALGGLTGKMPTRVAGLLAAAEVARRHGGRSGVRPALPVALAVPLADVAHGLVKYRVRRPRPLLAPLTGKRTPSYPSGHASRGAALAGMAGYAAVAESALPPSTVVALGAAVAVLGGGSRVYVDRHWATDAIGGWGLGLATAALCALWYERERR